MIQGHCNMLTFVVKSEVLIVLLETRHSCNQYWQSNSPACSYISNDLDISQCCQLELNITQLRANASITLQNIIVMRFLSEFPFFSKENPKQLTRRQKPSPAQQPPHTREPEVRLGFPYASPIRWRLIEKLFKRRTAGTLWEFDIA